MNAKQKKFITEELIPFVLREQGRGFGMGVWCDFFDEGDIEEFDGLERIVPKCNTVACIGGSISVLRPGLYGENSYAEFIGLTADEGHGLFYGWTGTEQGDDENYYGWPRTFRTKYEKANTVIGKARVAVALLKRVVATNGKCLHQENPNE